MPKIELLLPGEKRQTIADVADTYRITVERGDGIACTDIEANTTMSMFCIEYHQQKVRRKGKHK